MKNYKKHRPCAIVMTLLLPLFLSCVSELTNPYYYDSLCDIELIYCKKIVQSYFIFQDSLPEGHDTISSPDLLLSSLKDPYSYYVQPDMVDSVWNSYTTDYNEIGIGITIDTLNSRVVVSDVVPNSHAEYVVFINDTIIGINNSKDMSKISLDSVKTYLTGVENDSLTLHIIRNTTPIDINILYQKYKKRSVHTKTIKVNPFLNVAYIQIQSFSDSTCLIDGTKQEFIQALDQTDWANYTILDLRGNKGGRIDQCMSVISNFVPESTVLFNVSQRVYDTLTEAVHTVDSLWRVTEFCPLGQNRKFYVLMDKTSMGETELLISSLHAHRNDIITIGQRSKGKAVIQTRFATVKDGLVSISSGLVTPYSGSSYDRIGINPKIISSYAFEAAITLIEGMVK